MSDPVTNLEIEDVLASIRRLVTQADKPAGAQEISGNKGAGLFTGRLVLTPALRVTESEIDPVDGDSFTPVEPELVEGGTMPVAPEKPIFFSDRRRLEQTIAALEAAVARQADDWEPDGSEDAEASPQLDSVLVEAVSQDHEADAAEDKSAQDDAAVDDPVDSPEQAVGSADTAPADAAITDPLDEDEDYYADEVSLDFDPETEADAELDHELASYIEGESTIGEEALRDLVIQIVRAELHGSMGERITANVRKLVRKEINRALASREMD